jgi:hypothetical protein
MSACTRCMRLENDACLLGEDCVHYNPDSIKKEIIRRKLLYAERHEKEAARLRKEAEALAHDNH